MPIKYVSGKAVLTKLVINHKVLTTEWIPNIGSYIDDVIDDVNCSLVGAHYKQTLPVINGVVAYPDDYNSIEYITVDGAFVRSDNYGFSKLPNDVNIPVLVNMTCTLSPSGIKMNGMTQGIATIYYMAFKTEYDDISGAIIPYIPDNKNFIEACAYNVLRELMVNGYVHPIFNFAPNNRFTNIVLLYENAVKIARNTIEPISRDARYAIHNILNNPFKPFTNNISRSTLYVDSSDIIEVVSTPTYLKWTVNNAIAIWVIPHVFGKEPIVQAFDTFGKFMLGNVEQLTIVGGVLVPVTGTLIPTVVRITFDTPTSGFAILTI